ncbi:Sodium:neurotransmitter symporter family protein 1 [Aphelenchoides avenae]|nr:Sodium:neurotransmitter symporter family protein 1 [Aphelenchus avenae]
MSSLIVEEWRDLWSFKAEFMLVGFAYVFATTNFLNLPRLILENGGLAFVSAYGVALLAVVLPIIVLEMTVGQLTGRGPVQALHNICPVFKGVGVSQVLFSLAIMACMARFVAFLMLYLFHLFWTVVDDRPGLPWLHCKNFPELQSHPCREAGAISNITNQMSLSAVHEESSLAQFMRAIDNPSSSIADVGRFQLYLLVGQGVVWAIVFLAICFGVRWLGKVIVLTFLVPLALLLALFCRSMLLSGAFSVFEQVYAITDWERLLDYVVWKTAVEQAVLATGIGFGVFITIGSYNKRSNNLVGDSVLLLLVHSLLTVLEVSAVFGLVGFISARTGLSPLQLLDKGENQMWHFLAYLSYISNTKLFTGIALFMCICVLLNIFYLLSLNILATLEDALGEKWSRCFPRFCLALFVALIGCAFGLYFTTSAGRHAYELATGYLRYLTLWAILTFELLAVSWFYCAHGLGKDLRNMLQTGCCWCFGHFLLLMTYLLPAVPVAIATLNVMAYSFETYSEEVRNWPWSEIVGAAIAFVPLLPIPLFALFVVCASCRRSKSQSKAKRFAEAFHSPLRYENLKATASSAPGASAYSTARAGTSPRYTAAAPGYVLLPQAPLAEPEDAYNEAFAAGTASTIAESRQSHR